MVFAREKIMESITSVFNAYFQSGCGLVVPLGTLVTTNYINGFCRMGGTALYVSWIGVDHPALLGCVARAYGGRPAEDETLAFPHDGQSCTLADNAK